MHLAATSSGYARLLSLCEVTGQELDRRFRASGPGALPAGPVAGAIMLWPGTPLAKPIAHLVRAFAWQGKVFQADRGELVNRILLFRIKAVRAKVLQGHSWLDGRPCTVLDYSQTSLVAPMVRDEIREIEPGLWLGLAYMWRTRVARFALAGEVVAAPDG
jgi:hypothetical protein